MQNYQWPQLLIKSSIELQDNSNDQCMLEQCRQSISLKPWLFRIEIQSFLSTCAACLVVEFEWRATYFSSLRVKLMLAPLGMLKRVWLLMNPYRMLILQTSTWLPPSMQAPKTYWRWKVLYAKQPTPDQKSCWLKGWFYCSPHCCILLLESCVLLGH